MGTRKSSYVPTPSVPEELLPRLAAIVEVLAGLKSVSEAARGLGLSRNHFQTILHRGVLSLSESLTLKSGGRPAKPTEIARLQAQLRQLQRQNARLQKRVDATQRLLEVAGGLLHGRLRATGRQRRTRKSTGASRDLQDDSDPDTGRSQVLNGVRQMRQLGLTTRLCAAIAGVDVATLRRWRARERCPPALRARAGRRIEATAAAHAEDLVRRLHGLIGADALRQSVVGLSRRAAACVKEQTLAAMERERKRALMRITISQPGVLRGLDAMHFAARDGTLFALIGADGAAPYRTSLTTAAHYNAALVTRALRRDFEMHGAPLVLRLDRARAHDAPAVRELLDAHGVLALHGPPHYPCFYGQLERQNREHRAWIARLPPQPRALLEPCLTDMIEAVNALWRRRTLNWQTASEVWGARSPLLIDRQALHEEVQDRARHIAHRLKCHAQPADLAERLAIEQTLERRGYLRREIGGWC